MQDQSFKKNFVIPIKPFDDDFRLYSRKDIGFNPGLTILVGCNGSGKSTLLTLLNDQLVPVARKDKSILLLSYDDRGLDGSANLVSKFALFERYDLVSQTMIESEGEKIMHGICEKAGHIGHKIKTKRKLESKDYKEIWVLLDAVGSGLSIDGIISIKEDLVNVVIKDNPNTDVYFIISTNEYEFVNGEEDCIDITTFKHIRFKSYDDYKNYILKTRKKKDKRYK